MSSEADEVIESMLLELDIRAGRVLQLPPAGPPPVRRRGLLAMVSDAFSWVLSALGSAT